MNEEKNILIINGEEFEVDGENIIINSDPNGSRISVNGMPIKNYPEVKLVIEFKGDLAALTSYARTTVNGDINGNVKAHDVKCENVEGNIDSDNVTCKDYIKKDNTIAYFIFGHRHLPLEINIGEKAKYINLGEWLKYNTYGVFDGEKMELKTYK